MSLPNRRSIHLVLIVLTVAGLVGGCGSTAAPNTIPETSPAAPVLTNTDTPVPPTATPAPPTATTAPTAPTAPTETPIPPTDTPTSLPPTEEPTATAPPSPTATALPDASVKAETVNLRAGPGTTAAKLAGLKQSEPLTVLGQTGNCAWLKVKTADGKEGWVARVSGGADLVTLNKACEALALIEAPTAVPQPTARPQPTSAPAAPPAPEAPSLDPNLGCYLIENFIGTELTFTFTAQDWKWNDTIRIPSMESRLYCMGPGRYTYTIDGQPPWGGTGGDLQVKAGDRLRWPISGRQ